MNQYVIFSELIQGKFSSIALSYRTANKRGLRKLRKRLNDSKECSDRYKLNLDIPVTKDMVFERYMFVDGKFNYDLLKCDDQELAEKLFDGGIKNFFSEDQYVVFKEHNRNEILALDYCDANREGLKNLKERLDTSCEYLKNYDLDLNSILTRKETQLTFIDGKFDYDLLEYDDQELEYTLLNGGIKEFFSPDQYVIWCENLILGEIYYIALNLTNNAKAIFRLKDLLTKHKDPNHIYSTLEDNLSDFLDDYDLLLDPTFSIEELTKFNKMTLNNSHIEPIEIIDHKLNLELLENSSEEELIRILCSNGIESLIAD